MWARFTHIFNGSKVSTDYMILTAGFAQLNKVRRTAITRKVVEIQPLLALLHEHSHRMDASSAA